MKHRLLLYVLKFEDQDMIKIGISCELRKRISQLREDFENDFDLINSYVITARKETIKILESQILDDLKNDIPKELAFPQKPGITEVRLSRNLDFTLDLIRTRTKINEDIKIYKGIDFSGFRSKIIPRDFYPHFEESRNILRPLSKLIWQEARRDNISAAIIINEIIYKHYKDHPELVPFYSDSEFPENGFFSVPNFDFKSPE